MIEDFKNLLEQSERILITAHLGPDADSLCSSLLLLQTITTNFPDKTVAICMEEEYAALKFLPGYSAIELQPLADAVTSQQTQLLIILDGNNVARCSREPEPVLKLIDDNKINLVIIDHHEQVGVEPNAVYINRRGPAVTQDVYEIMFHEFGLTKPTNYAQAAMIGLYSDTGGFTYDNPRSQDTFRVASELIADGASAELAESQLTQYTRDGLEALCELIKNVHLAKDCTYTYISDEFYEDWLTKGRPADALHEGFDIFLHNFMRNIEGRIWGFAIYPDQNAKIKTYSVSFRSLQGRVDVAAFARKLGGGGHKPAAGAKIETDSVERALISVKEAVGLIE